MRQDPRYIRLIALFALFGLLFNYPLLSAFNKKAFFSGYPIFPLYLFLVWGLLIAAVAWVFRRKKTPTRNASGDE